MLKSAVIEEKKFKCSPWAGADNPLGPKFDVNKKASLLLSFVVIHHLFMISLIYIAAGRGQTTPGDKILMSIQTSCDFGHLLQVSNNLFEVWFYTSSHDFIHVYSRGAGVDNPSGQKCDVNRNISSLRSLLQNSNKSLWSLILYICFHILYMYIAPG